MNTITNDIDDNLKEIALKGIASRNKANKLYKQKVLSVVKPHEDNTRKQKEEEKVNQSIQKFLLRRERISEQLKQKRLETSNPKGRPFKYPENKLKKEEMIRQLNELKELRELNTIEQEIIESNELPPSDTDKKTSQKKVPKMISLEKIEIQIQKLLTMKQEILNKSESEIN